MSKADAMRSRNDADRSRDDAARSRNDAERSRTDAAVQTAEANSATAVAKADADQSRSEAARSRTDAESQSAQALDAREQLAAASGESNRLRAELEGLQAKQTDRGMVLTLGSVLFDTGQTVIRPGAMRRVDRLAEFLRNRPSFNVRIEGHTDSMGGDDYNLGLSQRRADALRAALVSRGVSGERVDSHGLGKTYPVASNDSASGRQQNRRVEIIFSDEKGQFSAGAERLSRS